MTHEEYCKRLSELDINDLYGRYKLNEQRIHEEIEEQYPQIMKDCMEALCNIERKVKEKENESSCDR